MGKQYTLENEEREIKALERTAEAFERIATALEVMAGTDTPLLKPTEASYTVGEAREPTEAEIQAQIEKLRLYPDSANLSDEELRRQAIKILEDDIPF